MNIQTTHTQFGRKAQLFNKHYLFLNNSERHTLLNHSKIFQSILDFKWWCQAYFPTTQVVSMVSIVTKNSRQILAFTQQYGNYLYMPYTNLAILDPLATRQITSSGIQMPYSFTSNKTVHSVRVTPQSFRLFVSDDYDYIQIGVFHRQQFLIRIEQEIQKLFQPWFLLPEDTIVDLILALWYSIEAGGTECIIDTDHWVLQRARIELGYVLENLNVPCQTMLTRARLLRRLIFGVGFGKFLLPYSILEQIFQEALLSEMQTADLRHNVSLHSKIFYDWDGVVNTSLLYEEYVPDLKDLLLLCGDVEQHPGPILGWMSLKSFLYIYFLFFVILLFIQYLNFSFISFFILLIFFYFTYILLLLFYHYLKSTVYPCGRDHLKALWLLLKWYFVPEKGSEDHWTEALNERYNKYTFFPIIIWLVVWAFVPLSTYAYYFNLISPVKIPNLLMEIFIPIVILLIPGVDILDPNFYIMSKPTKHNFLLDVTLPYMLAYLYFFSIEISWTSMAYFKYMYVGYLGSILVNLIALIACKRNKWWFSCTIFVTPYILLLIPYAPGRLTYILWVSVFVPLSHIQFWLQMEKPCTLMDYWFQFTVKLRYVIRFALWASGWFIFYLWLSITISFCTRYWYRWTAIIEFLILLFGIIMYFLPSVEGEELTFEWQQSYETGEYLEIEELVYRPTTTEIDQATAMSLRMSSYHEMHRGLKLRGGCTRIEHDDMDTRYALMENFEDVSECDSPPLSIYYCPNFELFLKTAEKTMEEQDNLFKKIKELKLKLAELNDREDALGKQGRSSFKRIYNLVSGKILLKSHHLKQWLNSKRYKCKPVWMTLASVPKIKYVAIKTKVERMSHLLPKKKFIMETLGNSINAAKEVWNIQHTNDRYLRPSGKACKQEPLLDKLAKEWKTEGANSFKYNSELYIKQSISRYFEKPTRLSGSNTEAIKEAAEALVHHNPKLYQGAELWSPEKILKKTVLKYSCQFPLTNNPNWKKKSDVVKALGKPEVVRTIADYIRSGHYFRSLHTVFLKLAVVNRPKIEANPGKQRTITAQDWLNYSLGMFVCGSVNKRFDFDSNSAPFTPILTGGLVRLATRLMKHKYFAAMDFTAADSYFSSLIDGVIHVRKLGFRNNVDFDYIANVLEGYYEGLETSVIINREQGRKYWKLRGFSTGHANTTPDNTIAEQLAMLMAWKALTKRPFHEYYIYNDQPAYGDDNILGSSYYDLKTWNATNISKYIEEVLGIPCRVEWEGNSLNGATFLAKQFCTDERVLQELKDLKINTPVAIIQDEAKLRQNFVVNLKNPNPTYIWNYCIGYLLQTASLPHVYKDVSDYLDNYLIQNKVSEDVITALSRKCKRPTYEQVMLMTYANKHQRKLGWVDHTPILPSKIIDIYKAGVGHLAGNLQIFENLTRSLRQFIPDAPEDHTKPLMIRRAMEHIDPQQFLLEAFIYYKADAPDFAFFKELCATSPYSTMLQPEIFCENLDIILPHITIADALTIPHVMSLVFYGINSSTRFWWNPLAWGQYLNKWLSKFYLEANYFWWTCTGRSSMTLSKLVPKDPAYYEKRLAYFCARYVRKILPNIMIDFKPYAIDAFCSDFVLTVPDAPRKYHPNWDEAMPRIAEMLKQHHHITLKARTASGKTYFLPQMLKEYFPYITILTVNNVLVKSNSTPGFSKILYNRRIEQEATYRIMTYGLWEALQLRPRQGEIVLLDEFAERDEALYYAVKSINTFSIAMSATPKVEGLPERPFIEVVVPRVHQIYTHEIADFEAAITICQELNLERWLFIIPNVEKVKSFAKQLNKTGLPATAVYSGQPIIPSTGHIVATTLVDSGVDIGDLDAVIDSGKSVKQINGQLRVVDSNVSVIEQRQGRVGRRKDGHYFKLSSTSPTTDFTKECSFFNALFKPSVASVFGITSPSHIDISEPLPPMFLCDELDKQNTMNLAYLSLKTHKKFSDAAAFYYKTLSNVEVKGNEHIIGRYEFRSVLFDTVLNVLDESHHRFTTGVENEILFNGKKFHSVKVRYSRVAKESAEINFVSKLTPGVVESMEEIETMEEIFASRFSPLSGNETSLNVTEALLKEDEKQFIRELFDL